MSSSKKSSIRSISLPTRSHPTTVRIEEELAKLKAVEISSTLPTGVTVCNSFLSLEELYKCLNQLLNLQATQEVISRHKYEKWVDRLLDGSLRILDICGNTKDLVTQLKEHLGDVHSCLRRRKGDSSTESSVRKFNFFKKKMKKDAKKLFATLKQMDNEIGVPQILNLDNHAAAVIKVLGEVSAISISKFQSLLAFLSVPDANPNQMKWSFVSNVIHKGQVDSLNEFEMANAALFALCSHNLSDFRKLHTAQNKLAELESCAQEIEKYLECVFRCLIRTRTSFLNMVSQ